MASWPREEGRFGLDKLAKLLTVIGYESTIMVFY